MFQKYDVTNHEAAVRLIPSWYSRIFLETYERNEFRGRMIASLVQKDHIATFNPPVLRWLNSLPDGAQVSSYDLGRLFVPPVAQMDAGKPGALYKAWAKFMSGCRKTGAQDGYWTQSDKKNQFGRAFINYHRKLDT